MTQILTGLLNSTPSQKKRRVVILLGPPGCGKGTQAPLLSERLQMPHISTGNLFRSHIQNQTEIGKKAKEFIEQGKLVPDEIVFDMLFERMSQEDCINGVILDGFPRTEAQAKALDQKIQMSHDVIVFQFSISQAVLIERILGRLSCSECGSSFHKIDYPPQNPMVCDLCNGDLYRRTDDSREVLDERMSIYFSQTLPLVSYYRNKPDSFHAIDASLLKEQVFDQIVKYINPEYATL